MRVFVYLYIFCKLYFLKEDLIVLGKFKALKSKYFFLVFKFFKGVCKTFFLEKGDFFSMVWMRELV